MKPRSEYRTSEVDNAPGVYVFRDRFGEVIYVGKAKSLRKRMASYFQASKQRTVDVRIRSLINSIAFFETFPVRSEEEALLLESRFIKQYNPRYNVVLRDDKRFLLIKIDLDAPLPRLTLARLRKDDGCYYFGPFPKAGVLRETCDQLTRFFGLRSCTPRLPGQEDYEHCHNDVVRACMAPCVGKVTEAAYQARVQEMVAVIEGNTKPLVEALTEQMQKQAGRRRFEQAAKLRDVIENVNTVFGSRTRRFRHTTFNQYPGLAGVEELQQVLGLATAPQTIECFDISNIAGTFAVGSMVCFVAGAPSKKDYRHFRIKTVAGIDDFAMIKECVTRRYSRLLEGQRPLPDLIVIDGGKGQLHAAWDALLDFGLARHPVIGLAKKQEEIFTIYDDQPLLLERHRPALRLLQAIRDEAHRFALSYNRELRRKRILDSMLDEIPGVGKKRKAEILKAFGSVRNLRKFAVSEISARVPSIGEGLAARILEHVSREAAD